jgi:hypothetical protein
MLEQNVFEQHGFELLRLDDGSSGTHMSLAHLFPTEFRGADMNILFLQLIILKNQIFLQDVGSLEQGGLLETIVGLGFHLCCLIFT